MFMVVVLETILGLFFVIYLFSFSASSGCDSQKKNIRLSCRECFLIKSDVLHALLISSFRHTFPIVDRRISRN